MAAGVAIAMIGCGGGTLVPPDGGRDGGADVGVVGTDGARGTDAADAKSRPDDGGSHLRDSGSPVGDGGVHMGDGASHTGDGGADVGRSDARAATDATDGGPQPTWFDLPGVIKLVPDPAAGLLYALTSTQVVVYDVGQKQEVTRVALGAISTDLDLSPDGSLLIAAQDSSVRLAVIDKHAWTVTYVGVRANPQQVEAMNGNLAYYVTLDQWTELHQVDLTYGSASDVKLSLSSFEPDIELSAAGNRLFVGESGLSGSQLYGEDLTVVPARTADQSSWDDNYGFYSPPRHVYLGPSGKNIYYAGHQLDATQLGRALGNLGNVYAEDAAATFAVAAQGIIDVTLRTFVSAFPKPISAAALTAADSEVWSYEPNAGRLSYAKVTDFLAGKTLGVRVTAAANISTYSFAKIIADPIRPRLYGVDVGKSVLVSIDSGTGMALTAAVIEYEATDVEIDAAGKYIYIGHSGMAIEQIDAATLTLVKYIFGPRDSYYIVVLANNRIASVDYDQWTTATIIDATSGTVLDSRYGSWQAALAATKDGKTLFVGGSDAMDSVTRYDVSSGMFGTATTSTKVTVQDRSVVVTPDGTSVYYAGACLNGASLTQARYQQTDQIVSISPNGVLAASATEIYRVSDGTPLMALPSSCPIQAIGSDSGTLYCSSSAGLMQVSLAGLH